MENLSIIQLIGVAGFFGYLIGFSGLQFGLIDGNGRLYSFISIGSATLVLISLTEHFNLASALIQISWIIIGLSGMTYRFIRPVLKSKDSGYSPLLNRQYITARQHQLAASRNII